MKKLIWLLVILFSPCVCRAATVNLLITANKTVTDWIGVDTTITDTIGLGRAVITEHRNRHSKFYTGITAISNKDIMVSSHSSELSRMRKQLQILGFKDENDLIQQSNDKDTKAGLKEGDKGWWQ